jgi:hypothetical protein
MEVEITRRARHLEVQGGGTVDGQVAVEADLMCTMRSAADASQRLIRIRRPTGCKAGPAGDRQDRAGPDLRMIAMLQLIN